MDFRHCLSPYCFNDLVVTICMGLLIKRPWFTFAHTEIGGGASFALLNKKIKIWCASTLSTGTRLFERCCHSREGFRDLMQAGSREREARCLRFTIQRPSNLIYYPHLLAHAVLTVDTGSPTIVSGWDAAITTHQINKLFFKRWMSILLVGVVVSGAKFSVKKDLSALRERVFSPSTGLQESMDKLQKHWNFWEQHPPKLLLSLHIVEEVPRKIKSNRLPPPPVQSSELRYAHKGAIGPGPST